MAVLRSIANGSVVAGSGQGPNGQEAFRWKQATGMIGLGVLPGGAVSVANAVNADGSVVVGDGDSANGFRAFR